MSACPGPLVLASLGEGCPLPEREILLGHVDACPACRAVLADLAALRRPVRRTRFLPLAVAASLLVAMGWAVLGRKGPEAPKHAPPVERKQASLEVEPGGDARLSGRVLILRAGACWLDTTVPVEMTDPGIRFEAGTEAEVRILEPRKLSLLSEAWASDVSVLVSVVSGSAEAGGVRIPAGSRLRIPGGRLEPLDPAPIFAWRLGRMGKRGPERTLANGSVSFPGPFSVEVRSVRGHVVLHYPGGETTLGNFEVWKDGAWHRVSVSWQGSGTEVFLDGRRILKLPGAAGSATPGLEVRSGSLVLREIRP